MEHIIKLLALTMPLLSLQARVTSEAIQLTNPENGQTRQVYFHEEDGTYYISHDNTKIGRQAYVVLPGASEILGDNVDKAWYDREKTVVYKTSDNKLYAIYPVYSECALTRQQLQPPQGDKYVGIYPNPNYQLTANAFYAIGIPANCFVYTKGTPYKTQSVPARLSKDI